MSIQCNLGSEHIIVTMRRLRYEHICRACGGYTYSNEWAMMKKVCIRCIEKIKADYEKEVKDEYSFEEYVDTIVTAFELLEGI